MLKTQSTLLDEYKTLSNLSFQKQLTCVENFIRDTALTITARPRWPDAGWFFFLTSWFDKSMTAELKCPVGSCFFSFQLVKHWRFGIIGWVRRHQWDSNVNFLAKQSKWPRVPDGFCSLITLRPQCFSVFQLIVLVLTAGNGIILEVSPLSREHSSQQQAAVCNKQLQ